MSRGGAMPMNRPTGWVYLHSGSCTIRWRRGDDVAYVLSGRQLESYPGETPGGTALAVIKVSPRGGLISLGAVLVGAAVRSR